MSPKPLEKVLPWSLEEAPKPRAQGCCKGIREVLQFHFVMEESEREFIFKGNIEVFKKSFELIGLVLCCFYMC